WFMVLSPGDRAVASAPAIGALSEVYAPGGGQNQLKGAGKPGCRAVYCYHHKVDLKKRPGRRTHRQGPCRLAAFGKVAMHEVTRILAHLARGDAQAAGQLLPLVYGELRKLAAARMAEEAPGNTLDPTALVHEAYLRLVGPADAACWD